MDILNGLFVVLGGVAIAVIAWLRAKLETAETQKEVAETKLKQTEEIVKNVETKNEIKRDVVTSDEPINDRLLNKWSRD